MTQTERIIEYIDKNGSITPMERFSELHITKLATRVGELKKLGYDIQGEWSTSGSGARFMRYRLKRSE